MVEEIVELDGQIVGVKRSLAHLLDVVEQGGLAAVAAGERLAARQAELTEPEAQRAEKERRKQTCAKALAPEELPAVLVALRERRQVPVARRALKAFVERVVVRGDVLRIDCRAEVLLALGELPPRGFRMKTSMMGGQRYWPEVWATPALAPTRSSAGASAAAAWRE